MNFFIKGITKSKMIKILVITASIVYLLTAIFINQRYIGSDGRSYQRMAVNIASGNGYSGVIDAPYSKMYFREPGYPFFFSIACEINSLLGNQNIHLPYKEEIESTYLGTHREIYIVRLLQAILALLTTILMFHILSFFLEKKWAFYISLAFIFYLPFTIFITFPQREILITFLLTLMGWLFIKSAKSTTPVKYDVIFGIIAAALVLTLQAYVFILPVFLLSHYFLSRNFQKTIKSTSIIGMVFIISVAPWILRAYNEVPDIRVAKSFGTSYTYEFKKYHDTYALAYYLNLDGEGENYKDKIVAGYSEPGKVMFEKSFNGSYEQSADSLINIIKEKTGLTDFGMTKYKLTRAIKVNFRKALVWPLWKTDYLSNISTLLSGDTKISMTISLFFGFTITFFFFIGLVFNIKRIWFFLPVFIFHFLMIPLMADEGRRVLPFMPFYFMFFILGIITTGKIAFNLFKGHKYSDNVLIIK